MQPDLAYIALGSNLGDPLQQLRSAGQKLLRLGQVVARSSLYRSPAQGGPPGQPDYLNAVVALDPFPPYQSPLELLRALLAIEVQNGQYLGEDDIIRFSDDYARADSGQSTSS